MVMLYLTQSKYIHDLLVRTKMDGAKPLPSPIIAGKQLSIHDGDPMSDPHTYRSTVGALQYLTLTRSDITFVVNKASQFMHNPTTLHWKGVKRILRYLNDWTSNLDDRKSMSGYAIYLGPNLLSCTKSEYRAIALAVVDCHGSNPCLKILRLFYISEFFFSLRYQRLTTGMKCCDAISRRTCHEIEEPFCDYIGSQYGKPVFLTGPVLPTPLEDRWAQWLGGFKPGSVIFCAFGSQNFQEKDQFQELLLG
ncbi:hypothetical protein AAG906_027029 [Vitis piasezkii]